jgi:uncharacterized protein
MTQRFTRRSFSIVRPVRFFAIMTIAAVTTQSRTPAEPTRVDAPSDLLAYDRSLPLDARQIATRKVSGVEVTDLTFAATNASRRRVAAYLVRRDGSGRLAGLLFVRGTGGGRRLNPFLDEAGALAALRVVSIVIDGNVAEEEAPTHSAAARQRVIDRAIDTRRAMDLLAAQPGVDPRRICFVGHDAGAMLGAVLAGVDRRAACYVLMAATTDAGEWALRHWPPATPELASEYRQALAFLSPINFVGIAAPAALFFQFGRWDPRVPEAVATELFDHASSPKDIRWYDADHELDVAAALADRRAWLVEQLHLQKP